ncbi:MAG: hypothetical protein F4Y07_06905 [Gemmatimonadetes bacterium]|nr:hypothetical protein [Gemmatimonadota bacterium]
MSFLEDLTFAQALMLVAVMFLSVAWARRWVKYNGTLHDRVCRLEAEVRRLADRAEGGNES